MMKKLQLILLLVVFFGLVGCEEKAKVILPDEESVHSGQLYLNIDELDLTNCFFTGYSSYQNDEYNNELFLTLFKEYLKEYTFVLSNSLFGPYFEKISIYDWGHTNYYMTKYVDGVSEGKFILSFVDNRINIWIPFNGKKYSYLSDGLLYISTEEVNTKDFAEDIKSIFLEAGGKA